MYIKSGPWKSHCGMLLTVLFGHTFATLDVCFGSFNCILAISFNLQTKILKLTHIMYLQLCSFVQFD